MAISIGDALLKVGVDTKDLDRGMDQASKNIQQGTDKWKGQLKAAGAAFTAAGVAGLALVASSKKMNASLGMTAKTIGGTTGELRNLALSVTNVTFPLESVVKTFDLLARAGIRDQQILADSATAFDTLADATGSSAETVAGQLIPAFKLFGLEIPKSAEELDRFTWLTKNTTVEISEFGSVMSYVAQYGDKLNLTLDDMIAIMAVLESKGKSGSTATKMFRTAVTQAASGASTLNEALGITQTEIDGFKTEMDGAVGITQEYADVANTQYGLMDKLKQKWSEITLKLGSFLEPLEPIMGAMAAIGPMMLVMSTGMGQAAIKTAAHTVALIAHKAASLASAIAMGAVTAAQWLLNVAMNANPIMLVVTVIGLLVAALIGLAKKFQGVRDVLVMIWDNIKVIFARAVRVILENAIKPFLSGLASVIDFGSKVVGFFNKDWGDAMKNAADSVRGAVDGAIEWTHELEDNAQAHRDQKKAIEETTKVTKEQINAADAYDEALYGTVLTTERATKETGEFTDALDGETTAFDALTGEADEATKALERWQDEQEAAIGKARSLWQETVIENSELGKLGITLDDVMRYAYATGVPIAEVARLLIQTGEAADQATAFLAAMGGTVEDLTGYYEGLTQAQREQIAVEDEAAEASARRAATLAAQQKADQEAFDLYGQQTAGQPDWFVQMAAFKSSVGGNIAGEATNRLAEWVEDIAKSGGDVSGVMQMLYDNAAQLTDLTSTMKFVGTALEGVHIPVVAEGWERALNDFLFANLSEFLAGLENFQHGGIVPGVGPQLIIAHGGEPVGAGVGVTNNFNIAELVVREEADIPKIARELARLQELRGVLHG